MWIPSLDKTERNPYVFFDSMDISDMCDNYWLEVLDVYTGKVRRLFMVMQQPFVTKAPSPGEQKGIWLFVHHSFAKTMHYRGKLNVSLRPLSTNAVIAFTPPFEENCSRDTSTAPRKR